MNKHIDLDKGPHFFGISEDNEPSVRQLIHKYYETHFPLEVANQYAMKYIELASIERPAPAASVVPSAACPYDTWTASKELA